MEPCISSIIQMVLNGVILPDYPVNLFLHTDISQDSAWTPGPGSWPQSQVDGAMVVSPVSTMSHVTGRGIQV
jgi:hypothetical protein